MRFLLAAAVLLSLAGCGWSARILAVFPFPGKSHFIFLSSVLDTLLQRGHQVVEYSPFPPSKPKANYTHFEIHNEFENFLNKMTYEDFMKFAGTTQNVFSVFFFTKLMVEMCEDTFKHEYIQTLLNSNEHFDLVMVESPFGQDSMVVFGDRFKAPVIGLQTFSTGAIINMNSGNALSIASVADNSAPVSPKVVTFTDRLNNFIFSTLNLVIYYLYRLPLHDQLIRKYYRENAPPLVDLVTNVSLYFVNAHPAIEYTRPYTPNIVPVAGINILPERSSLPQDLQSFMDDAKNGVIYFSLGSVFPTHDIPKEVTQEFVRAFSKLKQRVIWKTDAEILPGLSGNVKLMKWVPQPGVLAHRNCLIFMTHGGLFSQYEALYYGVPTIGIPIFAEQPFNVKFSESRGFGVKLDFLTLSEESILTAINTILHDKKYGENAQRLSRIFRDRPVSPTDSVVFWVEYVLRHAGAHHLRPASTRLSWYQLALLDVLAVIFIPILIIVFLFYKLCMRLCCKKDIKRISSSKKKN